MTTLSTIRRDARPRGWVHHVPSHTELLVGLVVRLALLATVIGFSTLG